MTTAFARVFVHLSYHSYSYIPYRTSQIYTLCFIIINQNCVKFNTLHSFISFYHVASVYFAQFTHFDKAPPHKHQMVAHRNLFWLHIQFVLSKTAKMDAFEQTWAPCLCGNISSGAHVERSLWGIRLFYCNPEICTVCGILQRHTTIPSLVYMPC